MRKNFAKPYKTFGRDINVKVDLSNYATKTDLKNVSHVDVSSFELKSNLVSLKTKIDKINAGKLKTVPVDLAKLSNVVRNDLVKKTEYNKLILILQILLKKNKYEKDGTDFEDKINKITKNYLMLLVWLKKQILIPKLLK